MQQLFCSLRKLFLPIVLTAGILFMPACSEPDIPKPGNLIPEQTYMDVLTEMQILKVWHGSSPDSLNVDSLRDEVFKSYGVDSTQFAASHIYYEQFIPEQEARVNRMIENLEAEQDSLQQHIKMLNEAQSDSVAVPDSAM